MSKAYYVYLMASNKNGTLYTGVTNNLIARISQHKASGSKHFTGKYRVHKLVFFEATSDVEAAIRREKQLKKWNRAWKIALIEKHNPGWRDLSGNL